jgi:hypothetical protein
MNLGLEPVVPINILPFQSIASPIALNVMEPL